MTGSLSSASWEELFYPFVFLMILLVIMTVYSYELDIFILGDSSAKALGINTLWVKLLLIFLSTLLTAVVVSKTGIIGFIGLVIPHIARKIIGYKHKTLSIFSLLTGGTFLVLSDTFARTYFSPEEMPIGVITAFCGTPLFLWIIRKNYSAGGRE